MSGKESVMSLRIELRNLAMDSPFSTSSLKIPDYTGGKSINEYLVRSGSSLFDFPFTDSLLYDQQFETDSQPVLTAGLFRTSRGPDRVQLSSTNNEGEQLGGLYVYEDNILRVAIYLDTIDFFDSSGTESASIVYVGNDLDIISTNGSINLIPDTAGGGSVNVAGPILPTTTDVYDIGSSTMDFRDLWLSGDAVVDGFVATQTLALVDGISAPSTVSGIAWIYVDSGDGDLKIKFGDGTVKTIVTDT